MADSQSDSNIFSVRIVSIDYYMAPPIPDIDLSYSTFQGGNVHEVPVIRIYGSTPAGQKTCLHVHRALPYLYVSCSDLCLQPDQEADVCTNIVPLAVEKALKLKGKAGSKRQHVHSCNLVRAKKFYGYHSSEELFAKIYLYYPQDVTRTANLLLEGAIFDKIIQPHESHIPYLLQFLVDYNLYGMGHLHVSKMRFRNPVPDVLRNTQHTTSIQSQADSSGNSSSGPPIWLSSTIPVGWIWQSCSQLDYSSSTDFNNQFAKRQSTCELEGDAVVDDILNQQSMLFSSLSQTHEDVKMVQSLIPIWEEEYQRTEMHGPAMISDPAKPLPLDVLRNLANDFDSEIELMESLRVSDPEDSSPCTPTENRIPFSRSVRSLPDERNLNPKKDNFKNMVPLEVIDRIRVILSQESSHLKAEDEEALRLLKWLASSQAEEDINSDDELVRETILSPLLPTATINKVLEKANLDFESESHRECQDILDSVEEPPNDNQNLLPTDMGTYYKFYEKTTNSEQSLQESADPDMGSSSTSNYKRKRPLWGSLPLSFTHKVNEEVKVETNRFTEHGKSSTVVKCSVRDLMRRNRSLRIEGESNVKPYDSISLINGKLPLSSGSNDENLSCSEGLEVKNSKDVMPSHNSECENPCVKDTDPSMKLEETFVKSSSMARCTTEITERALSSANEETSDKCLDCQEEVQYGRKKTADGYMLAPMHSPPLRDNVHEWLSSNDIVQDQVVDECLPYFEDVNCGLDALNYRCKFAMGVPTLYQNDGSYLYMLTPVFSPPSPHNALAWLRSDKSGHSDNSVGPCDSPPNDCIAPFPESGAISDPKPNINQIIQDSNSAQTQNKAVISEVKQGVGFSQDISQISGPDGKSVLTPLSQVGFRDPASVGCGQQLTIISIEVQAESRGDLRSDPRFDAINLIALVVQEDDDYMQDAYVLIRSKVEGFKRNVDAISGCKYLVFSDEKHMLQHFVKIISSLDPDILLGWDIQGNSIGFLAERAAYLGIGLLSNISRTPSHLNSANSDEIQDKEIANNGSHETSDGNTVRVKDAIIEDEWGRTHASGLHVSGRIVLNVWRLIRSEVKLNMYTAEAVAEGVLRRKVPHIHCKVLSNWFSSGPARARFRCIDYVFERAKLNLQLVNQLDMINRTSELARVFGIDFFSVLSRGSQYRVESMLLRLAHTQNYLAISPGPHQVASQPAMECIPLVMEPKSGFYADPVVVLDFQSLYPSMIIAYNLCFSTCLGKVTSSSQNVLGVLSSYIPDPNVIQDLKHEILSTPNGVLYVPSKVRRGVVPRLLDEILSTRIMVKQSMKKLTPSQQVLKRIFNARQLALKLIANVTYGYTAAGFSGRMPCAELADSIVQCGRRTLERAISFVNTHHKWKAKVIYGDTDSMFVQLKGRTVKEAFKIGYEIAAAVSTMNPTPVTLKMEKVYYPCFLLTKKRYVGYSYESPDQLKPSFDAKGVETIRRDTCPAVSKTLEKSLKLFFEHQDISKVKSYLIRQWTRILSGRISIQDFIFAKEVRLGTYSTRISSLPPAAIVATKAMRADPRAEPKYGDRIPYVVVHGEPGARLVDMVVDPLDLVAIDSPFRLNDLYYINKQIIPALQRIFGLVGAELTQWFLDMPRPVREGVGKRNFLAPNSNNYQRTRIDFYYLSRHCVVCGELVQGSAHLCDNCWKNNGGAATAIIGRSSKLEREIQHLAAICRQCGGGDWVIESGVKCTSLACSVLYERRKVQKELRSISAVATELGLYPPCTVEWF